MASDANGTVYTLAGRAAASHTAVAGCYLRAICAWLAGRQEARLLTSLTAGARQAGKAVMGV